jgi:AraC-like DNA-binding protein
VWQSVELPVSVPGLHATRNTVDSLVEGVKQHYAVGRTERGRSEAWGRGRVWRSSPGSIHLKEPGDVHRDIARDGPTTFTVVVLPDAEVRRAREAGTAIGLSLLESGDERAAPFHRLFDAVDRREDRLALEVKLTEAIAAFARLGRTVDYTRPVRRAMEALRASLAKSLTLDELADHAGLDKFHLCRAFRAQIGLPPHAYLTHLRVQRAKELLREGVRASELAPRVGLYDQSQLTRHFRRIVGTTPARYASSQGRHSGTP